MPFCLGGEPTEQGAQPSGEIRGLPPCPAAYVVEFGRGAVSSERDFNAPRFVRHGRCVPFGVGSLRPSYELIC